MRHKIPTITNYDLSNVKGQKDFLFKLQSILTEISNNAGAIDSISADPNGVVTGTKHETAIYVSGSAVFLNVNITGNTWKKVLLT